MTRFISTLMIVTIWTVLYLTNLGSSEFRSEEGHRVMPAVQMLDTGNYLVPYMGARPYLKKPPLINWMVAGSFNLFGVRNEWTGRLPSALFVLAVAMTLVTVGRASLGAIGSTMAALCWLTSFGIIEKGRMIEIEAIYASLFAFAFILWLAWWQQKHSPWLTFVVPWIFLGLGLLAKGPAHVMFFYILICAVLWRTRHLGDLKHPAHLVGILLMLGIFVAWAVPYFRALHATSPMDAWSREIAVAFHGEEGRSEQWSLNFPRGFAYFLPWLLPALFIRFRKIDNAVEREMVRGLVLGSVVPFVVILLIPGTLPRYVLPLIAPFSWMIGVACARNAFDWSVRIKNFRVTVPRQLIFAIVATVVLATMVIFPMRSVTYLKRHERIKPIAAQINALVPQDQRLYAIDPDLPYLFYVRAPITYLESFEQLPPDARYFLIQPNNQRKLEKSARWVNLRPRLLAHTDYRGESMLFVVEAQP